MRAFWTSYNASLSATATRFAALVGVTSPITVESQLAVPLSDAVTIKRMTVWLTVAPGAGKSRTFNFRDDGANAAAVTVSDTALTATWSGSVTVDALSLASIQSAPVNSPAVTAARVLVEYETAGDFYLIPTVTSGIASTTTGVPGYLSPGCYSLNNHVVGATTHFFLAPTSATAIKLAAFSAVAPGDAKSWDVSLRKNNTTDSLTATITGAATQIAVATGSTAIAVGDELTIKTLPTGPPATGQVQSCLTVVPSIPGEIILNSTGSTVSVSTTSFHFFHNLNTPWSTAAELPTSLAMPAGTFQKLYMKLSVVPGATRSYAFALRSDAADTSLAATISDTANSTNDTTHTVTVAHGALVNMKAVPTNNPGAANTWFSTVFIPATPSPKAETFTDDFATQDAAKWNYYGGAAATAGQLVVPCLSSYGAGAETFGQAVYDLTGSSICVEAVQMPNLGNGSTEAFFELGIDADNRITFYKSGADLGFRERVAGVNSQTVIAYNADAHRWWRIRESGGTLYWDTSPDGNTWTNRRSKTATIALTSFYVALAAGFWGTEPTPGTAIFDNVNVAPTSISVPVGFTGSGELSGGAAGRHPRSVSSSGTGVLSATTMKKLPVDVSLAGTGALTATRFPSYPAVAALNGGGTLSATAPPVTFWRTVDLTGTGQLEVDVDIPGGILPATGSLSGIMAIGTGVYPDFLSEGTLSAAVYGVVPQAVGLTAPGTLSAVRVPAYLRGPALAGNGTLAGAYKQIYTKSTALSGGGALADPTFYGTAFEDMNSPRRRRLAGSGLERYVFYPSLVGDGALAVASYKEIQTSPAPFGSIGVFDADLLPTSQYIWRTDENVAASSQPRPGSATAGVYVTLIGGGGGGRNGGSGAADLAIDGGGGGGGGAKVGRSFIPISSLGATYSVAQGAGTVNGSAPSNAAASTFTSGGITLTAGGGQGGKASGTTAPGGVASATGATATLANGGVGAAASSGSGVGGTAAANTNGAGAGGGAGGGRTNTNVGNAGGGGGDTLVTTGNNGGAANGGAAQTPTTVQAGVGGQGGGGGGGNRGPAGAGGNGAGYGGGGGGGGAGNGPGNGGDGAIGYTKLEWVGQIYQSFPNGEGTLSAGFYPLLSSAPALSGGGTLSATRTFSLNFTPYDDLNVSRTNIAVEPGCSGCYVTLIGGGGAGGNGCSGSTSNLPGGGGGGGAAKIERVFIPKASLGATYSVGRGLGVAGATGQASTFSSGGVTMSAGGGVKGVAGAQGGGGGTGGAGGTGSASGVTATIRNGTAGGRAGGHASAESAAAGTNNTLGGGAGGGGGGGVGSNGNSCAAAKGGNSQTVTGGNAGVTPPDAAAGLGGAGGGGNSGNGGLYGGGGGGGYGSTGDAGQIGGNGYSLIEWVS